MDEWVYKLLYWLVRLPIAVILTASPIVVVWWLFHPRQRQEYRANHEHLHDGVVFACIVLLTLLLSRGIETLLWLIPETWGGLNDDGDWMSTRRSVAYGIGLVATAGVVAVANLLIRLQAAYDGVQRAFEDLRNQLDLERKENQALRAQVPHPPE